MQRQTSRDKTQTTHCAVHSKRVALSGPNGSVYISEATVVVNCLTGKIEHLFPGSFAVEQQHTWTDCHFIDVGDSVVAPGGIVLRNIPPDGSHGRDGETFSSGVTTTVIVRNVGASNVESEYNNESCQRPLNSSSFYVDDLGSLFNDHGTISNEGIKPLSNDSLGYFAAFQITKQSSAMQAVQIGKVVNRIKTVLSKCFRQSNNCEDDRGSRTIPFILCATPVHPAEYAQRKASQSRRRLHSIDDDDFSRTPSPLIYHYTGLNSVAHTTSSVLDDTKPLREGRPPPIRVPIRQIRRSEVAQAEESRQTGDRNTEQRRLRRDSRMAETSRGGASIVTRRRRARRIAAGIDVRRWRLDEQDDDDGTQTQRSQPEQFAARQTRLAQEIRAEMNIIAERNQVDRDSLRAVFRSEAREAGFVEVLCKRDVDEIENRIMQETQTVATESHCKPEISCSPVGKSGSIPSIASQHLPVVVEDIDRSAFSFGSLSSTSGAWKNEHQSETAIDALFQGLSVQHSSTLSDSHTTGELSQVPFTSSSDSHQPELLHTTTQVCNVDIHLVEISTKRDGQYSCRVCQAPVGIQKVYHHSKLNGMDPLQTLQQSLSTMTIEHAVSNMVKQCSQAPAEMYNLSHRKGSLNVGMDADIVVLTNTQIELVFMAGRIVYQI